MDLSAFDKGANTYTMEGILINIITGIISGLLSGGIVYLITKKREQKYQTYYYLVDFLCRSAEDCRVEIPLDVSRHASQVGDRTSLWGKAINTIIEERRKFEISDEEIPEEYVRLSSSILVAFKELNKWANVRVGRF